MTAGSSQEPFLLFYFKGRKEILWEESFILQTASAAEALRREKSAKHVRAAVKPIV